MIVSPSAPDFPLCLERLSKAAVLSLDTETTGLRPYHGDYPFAIVFATDGEQFYYELEGKDALACRPEHAPLRDWFRSAPRVFFLHNAKFDIHMLRENGVEFHPETRFFDTMVAARLYNSAMPSYSLAACAEKFLGEKKDDRVQAYIDAHGLWEWVDYEDLGYRVKKMYFDRVPRDLLREYAEKDARLTYDLGIHLLRALREQDASAPAGWPKIEPLVEMEMALVRICADMERAGVLLDTTYCRTALAYEKQRYNAAAEAFKAETGEDYKTSGKLFERTLDFNKETHPRTECGNFSFAAEALEHLTGAAARAVLDCKDAQSRVNFFAGFLYERDAGSRIHTNLRQSGTKTGRFCIAKGTFIETPRDLRKSPKGVPIEDIKAGDLVYCYDDNLRLVLRKVIWAGKTGRQQVIRIHWLGQGRKHRGFLDVTAQHEVRTIDGSYKRADNLCINDSLLALGRSRVCGYARLHSRDTEIREHRLVAEHVIGDAAGKHVHHKDGCKINNEANNLEIMGAVEHTSFHAREIAARPDVREARSAHMRQRWEKGLLVPRCGADAWNYIEKSRFGLLRELAKCKGRPTRSSEIRDFATFKKKLTIAGIDIKAVRLRYRYSNGEYLSRAKVKAAYDAKYPRNYLSLGVGHAKFNRLCHVYGLKPWNHIVTKIEKLEHPVDVYDIEVEEHSNFIANEICVHNSSSNPNLQNLKRPDEDGAEEVYPIRRAFVPTPGHCFVMFDYKAMEYRLMLEYACQADVIEAVKNGVDVHQATAEMIGVSRQHGKTLNFALLYGAGKAKLAAMLGLTDSEAQRLKNRYFASLRNVRDFIFNVRNVARNRFFIFNWAGRRCHYDSIQYAYAAPNHLIQGGCADIAKRAMVQVDKLLAGTKSTFPLVVHDEFILDMHPDDFGLIPAIERAMVEAYPHRHLPMEVSVSHSWKSLADKVSGPPRSL